MHVHYVIGAYHKLIDDDDDESETFTRNTATNNKTQMVLSNDNSIVVSNGQQYLIPLPMTAKFGVEEKTHQRQISLSLLQHFGSLVCGKNRKIEVRVI